MTPEEAARLLDENPEATGVYDSAVGPILTLPPFRFDPDPKPILARREPRPPAPVPPRTLATIAWLLGVATSEAMGIAATAAAEDRWLP